MARRKTDFVRDVKAIKEMAVAIKEAGETLVKLLPKRPRPVSLDPDVDPLEECFKELEE